MINNEKKPYTCIESFCGSGGLALGLELTGFKSLTAFDLDVASVKTFNGYRGRECAFVADVREITGEFLKVKAGMSENERLDLFSGGPPCQGFSKQKKGAHLGDPRNDLTLEFARLVNELKPRFFLLENVAMLGQKRGSQYIEKICKLLNEYQLYPHFYNCADYGLAQTRERFVMVGRHKDVKAEFRIPTPTVTKPKTIGDVIGDLPEPPDDYTDHPDYFNHQRAKVTELNIVRFSHVPQGGGWKDIPDALKLSCHRNVDTSKGGWPDVYGRLKWDGQAPTITAGFDSFTRGRYGHPIRNRPLTPREAARLQGYPDDYAFYGTRADIRHQIGNSVPPPLAQAIGLEIMRSLRIADGAVIEKSEAISRYTQLELEAI